MDSADEKGRAARAAPPELEPAPQQHEQYTGRFGSLLGRFVDRMR